MNSKKTYAISNKGGQFGEETDVLGPLHFTLCGFVFGEN